MSCTNARCRFRIPGNLNRCSHMSQECNRRRRLGDGGSSSRRRSASSSIMDGAGGSSSREANVERMKGRNNAWAKSYMMTIVHALSNHSHAVSDSPLRGMHACMHAWYSGLYPAKKAADRQAGRQAGRQTGRQTGRQAGRQTGKQTGSLKFPSTPHACMV